MPCCAINTRPSRRRSFVERGYSSVGRASRSHREGQGFESPYLHFLFPSQSQGPQPATAASGGNALIEISVGTPLREVLVDITARVQHAVAESDLKFTGVIYIFVPHTTAGLTINEGADPAVAKDMIDGLSRLVPRDATYRHGEGNSDAHIKASLVGNHLAVPVEQGQVRLGTWQSIYLAEFDGPRTRRVWLMPLPATGS